MAPPQHLPQLLRAPPVLPACGDHESLELRRRAVGAPRRRATLIRERRGASRVIARQPLVARRPAHAVARAQLAHRPPTTRMVADKPQPLVQDMSLHPGHPPGVNHVAGLLLSIYPDRTPTTPTSYLLPTTDHLRRATY